MPVDINIYRFDLRGYIILKGALSPQEVKEANDCLDAIPRLKPGQWYGHVHGHSFGDNDGVNYQQVYEAGEPFEKMIDHPSWFDLMMKLAGPDGSFDNNHGPMFIDECFASFRGPGEAIGMHSGGDCWSQRNQYRVHHGHFMIGQVNVLIALTKIGPGDGGTVVIPASHKQNFEHPTMAQHRMGGSTASGDMMDVALEVFLDPGDALVFADTICHGSARRSNPGDRRIVVFRYGPSYGMFRHGYRPSPALLERLTPQRRQIVWPHNELKREPQLKQS